MEILYNTNNKNPYKINLYWFYHCQHYMYNDQDICHCYGEYT